MSQFNPNFIIESFKKQRDERPEEAAFLITVGDSFMPITWKRFTHDIDVLACANHTLLKPGTVAALLGENSYEWMVCHAAGILSGAVIIPLETTLTAEEIARRITFAGVSIVLHSALYSEKAKQVAALVPHVTVSAFAAKAARKNYNLAAALIAKGEHKSLFDSPYRNPEEICSIVFTSGTTSEPRGVELSLSNFAAFPQGAGMMLPVTEKDRSLMVLPLHHIFGICSVYFLLTHGAAVGVCPDFRRLYDAVQRFRATCLFLVPALADILARKLSLHQEERMDEDEDSRLDWVLTGGAPLAKHTYDMLQSLGIKVLQAYGLTETCSLFSIDSYDNPHPDTAGLASPLCEAKVTDDGELIVRGPNILHGYYKNPEKTAEAIKDGWFHTGDTGEIAPDGSVKIIGRRNRSIVLSNGKKIAPEELEAKLEALLGVREACVSGKGGDSRELVAELYAVIPEEIAKREVELLNRTLPMYKRIRNVVMRSEPFPRTASGKIKRS